MKKRFLQFRMMAKAVMITLLLSVAGLMNGNGQSFTVGNLYYSINSDQVSVTVTGHLYGSAATGTLSIPESVNYYGITYSVTEIDNGAFSECSGLTGSLTIPNSVVYIGARAFNNCSGFMGNLLTLTVQKRLFYNMLIICLL